MRRVVITGLGCVSPLGCGIEKNLSALKNGVSGIRKIDRFDTSDLSVKIAGQIPMGKNDGDLDLDTVASPKEQRHYDNVALYAFAAAKQAMDDCGFIPQTEDEKNAFGVYFGSGQGGVKSFCDGIITVEQRGPSRISPFFIPSIMINQAAGLLSIKYGLQGPNIAVSTACATGTHAVGEAYRLIKEGRADMMLAGSSEAPILKPAVAGFGQLRALSTRADEPEKASRPWDKNRDGFVMSEGAGALILEEYNHAVARGAKIYAEVAGYGITGDAYHITAPGGTGALRAMKMALKDADMQPKDIDYINAHGTSTPTGDIMELKAVKELFDTDIAMSSTKSMTGHMLGASGSVEAVFSVLAIQNNFIPPTINLENPEDEAEGMNLVPNVAQEKQVNAVLSNSFGFGGTNACLIFKKV
ncbi:MAG: beta-ketoacyl-[acyl-carrier-protein] synthase II [Alphaproteobacteria bacterium]|nr:beta-ketoacyl-[acyl-carrier-protein] synthase II [Alphaproteobacteria bacterium]